jgi:DNA-directed RNA polymerase specialized sigma24 family protein
LSAREIGHILDRSEGAIRVLRHRALRDLGERLEP